METTLLSNRQSTRPHFEMPVPHDEPKSKSLHKVYIRDVNSNKIKLKAFQNINWICIEITGPK